MLSPRGSAGRPVGKRVAVRAVLVATLLVALALLLAGCGDSVPHGRGVEETVSQFLRAAADRDGPSACARLSDSGKAAMAAYPKQPKAAAASDAACARTVEHLDRLPGARDWAAMAHGDISVASGAGLDAQQVTVSYQADATTSVQATGTATPPLPAVNSEITDPPVPVPAR